jgi:hypothetical protein
MLRGLIVVAAGCLAAAVAGAQERTRMPASGAAPTPAQVSVADFKRFHWIIGRWSGSGTGRLAQTRPFFEEYTLRDDSTIVMKSYGDVSFAGTVNETHELSVRDGVMRSGTSIATLFAGDSVQFMSARGGGRPYVFARRTPDRWEAVFGGAEPTPGTYVMTRVPR